MFSDAFFIVGKGTKPVSDKYTVKVPDENGRLEHFNFSFKLKNS